MTTNRKHLLAECRLPEVEDQLEKEPDASSSRSVRQSNTGRTPRSARTRSWRRGLPRIAMRIDALVAPAVPYGVSGDHRGFAGVPYVSVATLGGVIRDLAVSFTEGGFKHVVFVTVTTPTASPSTGRCSRRRRAAGRRDRLRLQLLGPVPRSRARRISGFEEGLHANVGETSAVMAVDPSLVEPRRGRRRVPDVPPGPVGALVSAFFLSGKGRTYRATRSGVWGDPSSSTAERGLTYLEQIEEACVQFMQGVEQAFAAVPGTALSR